MGAGGPQHRNPFVLSARKIGARPPGRSDLVTWGSSAATAHPGANRHGQAEPPLTPLFPSCAAPTPPASADGCRASPHYTRADPVTPVPLWSLRTLWIPREGPAPPGCAVTWPPAGPPRSGHVIAARRCLGSGCGGRRGRGDRRGRGRAGGNPLGLEERTWGPY